MPTPHDRLRQLRIRKGFSTASDAARAFGWNEHTYKSHENGIRGMKLGVVRKYASAFSSTVGYILGGNTSSGPDNLSTVVRVPVIARVSAGAFRYDDGIEEGTFDVPAVPRGDVAAAVQYSVIVDGPSVNQRIPDGAYAICAPYDSYPGGAQHGQLVHVVRERAGLLEHTIKELRFTDKGRVLVPVSDDPRHQEQIELASGTDGEIVRIQGVVIGAYTPF